MGGCGRVMGFLSKHPWKFLDIQGLTVEIFSETGTLLGKEGNTLKYQAWKEILDVLKEQASKFNVSLDLR
jgi:hypothetical protein